MVSSLTPNDVLPPPETRRWVARRKASIVEAVRGGRITLAEACRRYALSIEEFLLWQKAIESEGLSGLRATLRRGRKDGGPQDCANTQSGFDRSQEDGKAKAAD